MDEDIPEEPEAVGILMEVVLEMKIVALMIVEVVVDKVMDEKVEGGGVEEDRV